MLTAYLSICSIAFIFICFIWSSDGALNCLFKTAWAILAIVGILLTIFQFLPSEIVLQNGIRVY